MENIVEGSRKWLESESIPVLAYGNFRCQTKIPSGYEKLKKFLLVQKDAQTQIQIDVSISISLPICICIPGLLERVVLVMLYFRISLKQI